MVTAVGADHGQKDGVGPLVVIVPITEPESVGAGDIRAVQTVQKAGPVHLSPANLQTGDRQAACQIAFEGDVLVDATPVGDSLLDETLADIAAGEERDARFWVERTASRAEAIREEALSRLIAHGILERRDDRFLWVFQSRRYPTIHGEAEREVKLRIMGVLFSDEIPYPRDVVIICLADACGIFKGLLSRRELSKASARIEQVRKLDLIGQAMSRAVQDIELLVATSAQMRI